MNIYSLRLLFFGVLLLALRAHCRETTFTWKPIARAISYQIKICRDKLCQNPFVSEKKKGLSFNIKLDPGIYYFTLAPVSITGKVGYWAPIKQFPVAPPKPNPLTPHEGKRFLPGTHGSIDFEWGSVFGATSYTLELRDKNGKSRDFRTGENTLKIKPPGSGSFEWRIKSALNRSVTSEYTEPRKFFVEAKAPKITNIYNNIEILMPLEKRLTVTWEGEKFKPYVLKIFFKAPGSEEFESIVRKRTREKSLTFSVPGPGLYRIELTGLLNKYPIRAEKVVFSIKKDPKGMKRHRLALHMTTGAPQTSSTSETDPEYTLATRESPGTVLLPGLEYTREFSGFFPGISIFDSPVSDKLKIFMLKIELRYCFYAGDFTVFPGLGFHSLRFYNRADDVDNFKLIYTALPHAGISLSYLLPFLSKSLLKSNFSIGSALKESSSLEWDIAYEYVSSRGIGFSLGYYQFILNGKWIPAETIGPENPEGIKKTIRESYQGIRISAIYEF